MKTRKFSVSFEATVDFHDDTTDGQIDYYLDEVFEPSLKDLALAIGMKIQYDVSIDKIK